MDHLSKQQLILLALLVSFVTSLATGIFTVSLMGQAPQGVVQTINQVVEKIVAPQAAAVNEALGTNTEDKIPSAVVDISKSIVRVQAVGSAKVVGLGLVVSKEGIVMTDKSLLSGQESVEATLDDKTKLTMTIIQSQINGDIVFLVPTAAVSSTISKSFAPITFARSAKLGQTVLTLSDSALQINEAGNSSNTFNSATSSGSSGSLTLSQGIVSRTLIDNVNPDGSQPALIETNISGKKNALGSPIFNLDGEVIGMSTKTVSKDSETAGFYPVMQLKGAVPKRQ